MIKKIKCFFFGHIFDHARYSNPLKMPVGFVYYGLYCECRRCGKIIDYKEEKHLPIIEPNF